MSELVGEFARPVKRTRARRSLWQSLQLPVSAVLLLLLWQGAVKFFDVPSFIIPPPTDVAASLFGMFTGDLLLPNAGVTLFEALGGFVIAVAAGLFFAVLIVESPFCERVIYPYFAGLQSMPKVAIAPLVVIWFGYGLSSKVVLAALLAFFPMLINCVQGLKAADPGRLKLMRALDAPAWQVLRHVRIPYAMPFFLAGLELAGIYALLGAIVGEFVGSKAGLGYWMMAMNMNVDTSGSFALLVLLAVYGIALQRFVGWIRRRTLYWAQTDSQARGPRV